MRWGRPGLVAGREDPQRVAVAIDLGGWLLRVSAPTGFFWGTSSAVASVFLALVPSLCVTLYLPHALAPSR